MTKLTVKNIVSNESIYQRACAEWICRNVKHEKMDVYKLYGADFDMEYIEGCPTCGPEEWMGLRYTYNGRGKQYSLRYYITPGEFLEQCVAILNDPEFIPYP